MKRTNTKWLAISLVPVLTWGAWEGTVSASDCDLSVDVCLSEESVQSPSPATAARTQADTTAHETAIPAVSQTLDKQVGQHAAEINKTGESVAALVDAITADLKARRLTLPPGDNALEKMEQLRSLSPDHDYALNGRRYVAGIYLSLGRWQLGQGNAEQALRHLQSARAVDPAAVGLLALQARLSPPQLHNRQLAPSTEGVATAAAQPTSVISQANERQLPTLQEQAREETSAAVVAAPASVPKADSGKLIAAGDAETLQAPTTVWKSRGASEIPQMVGLPAGLFYMGSERFSERERPIHQVAVQAFSMSRYEITVAQYRAYAQAVGQSMPQAASDDGLHPVTGVSWNDVQAYVDWLSHKTGKHYRLPSEVEWEFAARAGTDSDYFWGNLPLPPGFANCVGCDVVEHAQAVRVGQYEANDFGLYDMHGNVWEWVQDCWVEDYSALVQVAAQQQPAASVDCSRHVLRGGSWYNSSEFARSAYRGHEKAEFRDGGVGFRVVHDGL